MMPPLGNFFKRWSDAKAEKAARRAELKRIFESFVHETQPFVPSASKHREAALYRHAWGKRT